MGKTFEDRLKNLGEIFSRLKNASLKLNLKKCWLYQEEVHFPGQVISESSIKIDPTKIKVVKNCPRTKNKHDIRRLSDSTLTTRNPSRTLVKHLRIHRLTENNKKYLTAAPILIYQREEGFHLDYDAPQDGLGSVLCQEQHGKEIRIAYFSKIWVKLNQIIASLPSTGRKRIKDSLKKRVETFCELLQ